MTHLIPLDGGDGEAGPEVGVTLEDGVGGGQELRQLRELTEVTNSYLVHAAPGRVCSKYQM